MSLAGRLDKLRAPTNYFAGTGPTALSLPSNVVVFHRAHRDDLGALPHHHHRLVLIVNFETAGRVIIDAGSFAFPPGQALLIFPHQFHHYLDVEAEKTRWLFVTFELSDLDVLEGCKNLPVALSRRGESAVRGLLDAYRPPRQATRTDNQALVLYTALLLNELAAAAGKLPRRRSPVKSPHQQRIDRIHQYIVQNIRRRFTIAELAGHFALSESHLRSSYRRATGMNLGYYIQQIRLTRASGLLLNSELNVGQVADACGYDSLFSFSRAFKRKLGVSPRDYRRKAGRP